MSCLAWPSSFSLRILWVVYCWPILEVDPKNNAVFRRDSVLFLLMNSMFLLTTYSVHDGVADMHLDQLNWYHLVGPFVHSTLMPEFWRECQFHWEFFFLQSVDPLLEDTYQWSIKPPMYYMCLVQIDSPILPFKASCPVSNDSHSNIQPVIRISKLYVFGKTSQIISAWKMWERYPPMQAGWSTVKTWSLKGLHGHDEN